MQLTGRTLFHEAFDSPSKKAAQMTTAEAVQAAHEFTHVESPSYHPGMPSMQLTGRRLFKEVSKSPSKAPIQFTTSQAVRAAREFVQRRTESYSPRQETLKRKHVTLEEEIPSSSPLQPSFSPKRKRQSAAGLPLEIASTPDGSPLPRGGRRYSPLFVETEEQANEDAAKFNDDIEENGSPLGRQLSDTLSEPGHRIDDTQAVFRDPTQPLDFDVPPPEEGWGNLEDDGEWDKSDPEIPETEQPGFLVPDESEVPGALVREESLEVGLLDSDEAEDLGIPVPDEKEELGVLIPDEDEELGVDEDSGADASESGSESQSESLSTITEGHDQQIIIPETQAILQRQTQNLAPDFTIAEPDGGWDSLIPSSPPHIPGSPSAESEASSITDDQMQVWMDARVAEGITEDQAAWVLRCTSLDTELASEVVKYLAKNGDIPQRRRGVWTEADDEDLRSTDARKIQHLENKHGTEGLKGRWDFLEEMNS